MSSRLRTCEPQFSKNPQEGLKAAAQQFETLFLQMVMKSMRDAVPQDGLFNSDQSRFYTGMLDQQMAQNLATSGKGVGFARLIEQQLGRNIPGAEALSAPAEAANAAGNALPLNASDGRHLNYKTVLGSLPTSAPTLDRLAPRQALPTHRLLRKSL
jgi:flagellar protein FlgJ